MKTKHKFCSVAPILLLGTLVCSAQTGDYLYSGSKQTITLGPGLYDITAYGAQGDNSGHIFIVNGMPIGALGGLGVEMSGEFSFSGLTTLTLLVGGAGTAAVQASPPGGGTAAAGGGGGGGYNGGGGGALQGSSGGGGGSIIDSSAFAVLTEVSGVASPDGSLNGEIIITSVPEPTALALAGLGGLSLLLFRRQRK